MKKTIYDDTQCQEHSKQTIYLQPFFKNVTCAFDFLRVNLSIIYEIIKALIEYPLFLFDSFCEHSFEPIIIRAQGFRRRHIMTFIFLQVKIDFCSCIFK